MQEIEVVSDNVGISSTDTPGVYAFGMPAEDVEINAVFAPAYAVDTDDNTAVVRWVGWDTETVTEAMENEELSVNLLDTAQPDEGCYFTGEYLLNTNSLGSETASGVTWYISDFVMPPYDVMIEAVQAEQEILTVDLSDEDTAEITNAALMQMSRDVEMTYDETTEADLLDLNNSGTPDLSFSVTYVNDATGENIIDMHYFVQRLEDSDAHGEYSYTFSGITDRYSEIRFTQPTATYILGDVDGDGEISITDATLIQRFLAEYDMPDSFSEKALDVDGDGDISITDVTYIQRYLAEYPVPYPINEYVG